MTHPNFDFVQARQNMIENQLRPAEVSHVKLIEIMHVLPREYCVLNNQKEMAYSDINISLFDQRYLSEPRVLARLVQLANIEAKQKILVIGAGTGYLSAIISLMGAEVYALEENEKLSVIGKKFCNEYASDVQWCDGTLQDGYPKNKFYDAIIIDGCIKEISKKLIDQLNKNGHIITVLKKDGDIGHAVTAKKIDEGIVIQKSFYAALPYLPEFMK